MELAIEWHELYTVRSKYNQVKDSGIEVLVAR
jgi:hypothetical protein